MKGSPRAAVPRMFLVLWEGELELELQSRLASLPVRSAGTIHSHFSVTSSKGSSSRLNQGSTETCKGKFSLA